MVFEGRDAAGKGGTIKRFLEHLDRRGAEVVALNVPSEREQGEWFFQRYVRHLPNRAGTMEHRAQQRQEALLLFETRAISWLLSATFTVGSSIERRKCT